MTSEERMREALRTIRDIVDTCHSNTFGADLSVIHGIAIDALHSVEAEKEPEWISCEERLPAKEDADAEHKVWCAKRGAVYYSSWDSPRVQYDSTHWMPTGLRRPAPPEHKPE